MSFIPNTSSAKEPKCETQRSRGLVSSCYHPSDLGDLVPSIWNQIAFFLGCIPKDVHITRRAYWFISWMVIIRTNQLDFGMHPNMYYYIWTKPIGLDFQWDFRWAMNLGWTTIPGHRRKRSRPTAAMVNVKNPIVVDDSNSWALPSSSNMVIAGKSPKEMEVFFAGKPSN